jgi:hypothetical protein
LGLSALTAERDQARPAKEVAQGREALDVTDESDVQGGTVLAYAAERFQVSRGVELAVEWTHRFQAELVGLLIRLTQTCLFAPQAILELCIVEEIWVVVQGGHSFRLLNQGLGPGDVYRLLRSDCLPGHSQLLFTSCLHVPGIIPVLAQPEG